MALHKPWMMTPASGDPALDYSQAEFRNLLYALQASAHGSFGVEGVATKNAFLVSQRGAGANFSVDIAAGTAFVTDDDITSGGVYGLWLDAVYNLATPAAPASGTRVHRVVLQLRNKSENGTYTTYDFLPVLLQDTGAGTPAEPASAITVALVSIAAGQASVQNANITDQRPYAGTIRLVKPADTPIISNATLTADPDLQVPWLVPGAQYRMDALLIYDSGTGQNFSWNFSVPGGAVSLEYGAQFNGLSGSVWQEHIASDVPVAAGAGVGSNRAIQICGEVTFSAGGPLGLRWAQGSSGAFTTTLHKGSFLVLDRLL